MFVTAFLELVQVSIKKALAWEVGGGSIMIDIIYKACTPCDNIKFLSKQQSLGLARRSKTWTAVIDRVRWEAQALGRLGFAGRVEF